jgi:hypothetical protein
MSMHDDEPELAGYEPGDGTPLRSRRMLLIMRIVVVVGLVAFVLPGIITTLVVAANAAQESCRRWVGYEDSGSEANATAVPVGSATPRVASEARSTLRRSGSSLGHRCSRAKRTH